MKQKGIFEKYAIGGGVAVLFYVEPVLTIDLDIFCVLPSENSSQILKLSAIYDFLKGKGYKTSHEQVLIEGLPVQFIPAYDKLVEEAVNEAKEAKYGNLKTYVIRVEHLIAIMLQTYRPKDKERILLVLREAKINRKYLVDIFERHNLKKKWAEFSKRYEL